jgi:hypothetical protein
VAAVNCAALVLNGSFVGGGSGVAFGPGFATAGSAALASTGSQVSATRTTFRGGSGAGAGMMSGKKGGDGIDLDGGFVFLSGCSVDGGAQGGCSICAGSNGLHVDGGGLVQFVESTFAAGPPGDFVPGQDIDVLSGTVQDLLEQARVLSVSAPLRSSQAGTIDYIGVAGDDVAISLSPGTVFLALPSKAGVWQLAPPVFGPVLLGAADAQGHLAVPFTAPEVAPLEGVRIFVQAFAQEASLGALRLGGPSVAIIVDDVF